MKQIYLDSNVIIPLVSNSPDDSEDKENIIKTLKKFEDSPEIEFVMSHHTILETVKILRVKRSFTEDDLHKIYNELALKSRILGIKIKVIDFSIEDDYSFTEMFYDMHIALLKQKHGIEDAMHVVIMQNNNIDTLMTFNESDFLIPGFTVINPKEIANAITETEEDN